MIDNCANPNCSKPLHYLRDGTVYVFENPGTLEEIESSNGHRLDHYWLCAQCSQAFLLERTAQKEILVTPRKKSLSRRATVSIVTVRALAS